MIWKNADTALAGVGDVDCIAPAAIWTSIVTQVREWATDVELGPVIVCNHWPDGMFVVALDGGNEFFQLDVRSKVSFRASTVFEAEEVAEITVMDTRGFRRLRPGAEGLLKMVLKGLGWGGRPREGKLRSEGVLQLISQDEVGVRKGAALFGPAGPALVSAAESYRQGGWNRAAMFGVELGCGLRALRRPALALRRVRFRSFEARRCPVLDASINGSRRPPGQNVDAWLARVSELHQVFASDRSISESERSTSPRAAE